MSGFGWIFTVDLRDGKRPKMTYPVVRIAAANSTIFGMLF